jgi:hypothetical protein
MTIKDELIHKLLDEIMFLKTTKISNLDYYKYKLYGDLSESRSI